MQIAVTPAMRAELNEMKITDFDLYEVVHTREGWDRFVEELFYHKLRLLSRKTTPGPKGSTPASSG